MNKFQCRICIKDTKRGIPISKTMCNQPIWRLISEIGTVTVELADGLPQCICLKCFEDLQTSIELRHTIQATDEKLRAFSGVSLNQVFVKIEVESILEANEDEHEDKFEIDELNKLEVTINNPLDVIKDETKEPKFEPGKLKKKKETKRKTLEPFQCCMCSKVFVRKEDLKSHCDAVHPEGKRKKMKLTVYHKFQCPYCRQWFHMKKYLDKHFKDPNFQEPRREKVKYLNKQKLEVVCPICGVKKCNQASLLMHNATAHTEAKNIVCGIDGCTSTFGHEFKVQNHQKACHGEKRFICDCCSKRFNTRGQLRKHMFIHLQHRPFLCDKCDKSYSKDANLKEHYIAQHSEVRAYRCNLCPKAYKYKGDLHKHRQSLHLGQFTATCKFCGKGYTSTTSRNYHQKRCLVGLGINPDEVEAAKKNTKKRRRRKKADANIILLEQGGMNAQLM